MLFSKKLELVQAKKGIPILGSFPFIYLLI